MKTNQQDLILKMLEGNEAGQLVPIQVEQCLLGTDPQCAIIRTPDGVQAQCTKGLMLVNDVETKVKWLVEGDTVTLGNSTFEIAELGQTEAIAETVESNEPAADSPNTSNDVTANSDVATNSLDGRIQQFETLLNEQKQQHLVQTEALEERLTHITLQLESLCDHLLDFEDRIEEQKLLTKQAMDKQQLLEDQVAAQPVVAPVVSGLAAMSTPTVAETFVTEPLANEANTNEPTVAESKSSDTVVLGNEDQAATETTVEEAFLPTEEANGTENSLLDSLGLSADNTVDESQTEPTESAVSANELDSVFGTASQQPETIEEETIPTPVPEQEPEATDTSELDSLLDSLQSDVQDEPSADADGGLGALEDRIADAQASLSSEIADESPATELNSLFNSLESEIDETGEPATSEEPTSQSTAMDNISTAFAEATGDEPTAAEKPVNESVADVLARMNPDGVSGWDEEDSASVAEPPMETESPAFAATDQPEATAEGVESAEGDGNVDDYMSALLQRLKTGPADNAPTSKKAATAGKEAPAKSVGQNKAEPVVKMPTLKPEEFVPKSVAKVQTNKIAAMRALANQSASNSVVNSNIKRNQEKSLGLQIGSLLGLFSGIILFMVSHRIFDLFFVLAVVASAIGAACLYLLYGRKKPKTDAIAQADASQAQKQNEQPAG